VLLGNGDGTFQAAVNYAAAGAALSRGRLQWRRQAGPGGASGSVSVLLGNVMDLPAARSFVVSGSPWAVAMGDFNATASWTWRRPTVAEA